MIRVCVVCEGQTEIEFIKSCVTPHLMERGVHAYPSIIRAPSGRHRGGRVTVERVARFLAHEYRSADRLTTLVDYYGFQDADGRTKPELEQAISHEVIRIAPGIDPRFVRPYLQMHEFEGLLFSDTEQFQYVLDGWNSRVQRTLLNIRAQFDTPEDINNGPMTAPSKRILEAFADGTYSKTEHGPVIAESIGIAVIREQCPQFDLWMSMLEDWAHGS